MIPRTIKRSISIFKKICRYHIYQGDLSMHLVEILAHILK